MSLTAWGWHNEAGIQVLRLILSGAFEKYSGLYVISGHWGEWSLSTCSAWMTCCRLNAEKLFTL